MGKYTKRFSVEEVQEILNKHMGVKDTRIHCLTSMHFVRKSIFGGLIGRGSPEGETAPYKELMKLTKKEIGAPDKRSADIDREFFGDDGF